MHLAPSLRTLESVESVCMVGFPLWHYLQIHKLGTKCISRVYGFLFFEFLQYPVPKPQCRALVFFSDKSVSYCEHTIVRMRLAIPFLSFLLQASLEAVVCIQFKPHSQLATPATVLTLCK